ncbi:MAG: Holliday junction resolvase RuvX [Patescibacteria group bacterium]
MKYLGIDYGESKVGLSLGDSESGLAFPYKIIKNNGWHNLSQEIAEILEKENIGKIVIGLPLNLYSKRSKQTMAVKKFADDLAEETEKEIALHDERFTSQQAQKMGSGSRDDDVAAMIMLQSYLDKV